MLAVILVVGPLQDALFGLVLIANSLTGIVQELRAKRALDHLTVIWLRAGWRFDRPDQLSPSRRQEGPY